jgi:hypothetical protein
VELNHERDDVKEFYSQFQGEVIVGTMDQNEIIRSCDCLKFELLALASSQRPQNGEEGPVIPDW